MSDIPLELIEDILLRVPAEALLRFRSVRKEWLRIIDDNTFVKLHLERQTDGDQLMVRIEESDRLYLLPLSSLECSNNITTSFACLGVTKIEDLQLASANGLILIVSEDQDELELSNPFTRESFVLPRQNLLMVPYPKYHYLCSGIGFDSTTDDFKVVRILEHDSMFRTLVYSLKLNSWKSSTDFPVWISPVFNFDCNGLFLNGALHWTCFNYLNVPNVKLPRCIIAFDLSTEEYRVWPFPSFLSGEQNLGNGYTLDMLDGYLCLRNRNVIWMMKDYGQNVWTEFFSLHPPKTNATIGKPLAYIKSKGQVLFEHPAYMATKFLLFDVEKKCAKEFSILEEGISRHFTSQVFPSSLFRLNQSGGSNKNIAFKGSLKTLPKTG